MELTDSPPASNVGRLAAFSRGRPGKDSIATAASARVRNVRSRLEATGGIVPSVAWLQQALDALAPSDRGGGDEEEEQQAADAVFAQALHHDLRDVVDRPNPSRAALGLRNEIRQSMEQDVGFNGAPQDADRQSPRRLLVQLEDVVNVALSLEARMQRQPTGFADPPNHSSSSSATTSGSRCLKLQLVDGYQHPLQPSDSNGQRSNVIVAMELSPVPRLSEQSAAGTKLLLTLRDEDIQMGSSRTSSSSSNAMRVSHGVLLLTPHNCLVVGGHVAELAAEQARERKVAHDQSGASITDPTIRALVSNHYMTDANADDDADVREGESEDVPVVPRAVRSPAPAPVVTPHPVTLQSSRTSGIPARSTAGIASGSVPAPAANRSPSAMSRRNASGTANNPYLTSMPSQRATASSMPPPPAVATSHNGISTAIGRANATAARGVPMASNPYATNKSGPAARAVHSQRANDYPVAASTSGATSQIPSTFRSEDAISTTSSLSFPEMVTRASSPSSQRTPFKQLFEQLQSASRQRSMYEQLYGQTFHVKMVQLTPKLHFNIEKIPRNRRQESSNDCASQRKHEYVLTARFRGRDDDIRASITCKLASHIMEPFFVHSADDLRNMKKKDRARVDELVLQGGRNLQNWTNQEQLYRVNLILHPDEFFAFSPPPALDNDSVPLLLLSAP